MGDAEESGRSPPEGRKKFQNGDETHISIILYGFRSQKTKISMVCTLFRDQLITQLPFSPRKFRIYSIESDVGFVAHRWYLDRSFSEHFVLP